MAARWFGSVVLCSLIVACPAGRAGGAAAAEAGNRLVYLDAPCDPYYVGLGAAKLTTPQWVGEPGVELAIVLSIDDMQKPAVYETFLRPILERLKKIDGRAPLSIMTPHVDPADPQLQVFLKEGVSIESQHGIRNATGRLPGIVATTSIDRSNVALARARSPFSRHGQGWS